MSNIHITEMIITCEACGNVKRFQVKSQHDCDGILNNFACENNCGRSLISYFTIGSLVRETNYQISMDDSVNKEDEAWCGVNFTYRF